MPWILDEDQALKAKLSGYQVVNYADGSLINVPVYFRFPDIEERTRTFPHIAIDLVAIVFDAGRAHRADHWMPAYYPGAQFTPPPQGTDYVGDDMPLPWTLSYQIATYAREPRHDRQLQALMYFQFPETFGTLDMSTLDGTVRRADFVGAERRDTVDADRKRLYRNIFTIDISSEFSLYDFQQIVEVNNIVYTVTPTENLITETETITLPEQTGTSDALVFTDVAHG